MKIKFNTVHEASLPANVISEQGIATANAFLYFWGMDVEVPDSSDWRQWLVTKGKYAGTWTKRLSNYLYKEHSIKLTLVQMQTLGNCVSDHCTNEDLNLYVDFVRHNDWVPGTFKESETSCWWNDYNNQRLGLIKDGGFAVRFFDHSFNGLGRAWMFPIDNYYLLFNNYGLGIYEMARIISHILGLTYSRTIEVHSNVYVNSGKGIIIGDVQSIDTEGVVLPFFTTPYYAICEGCLKKIELRGDSLLLHPRRHYHVECAKDLMYDEDYNLPLFEERLIQPDRHIAEFQRKLKEGQDEAS